MSIREQIENIISGIPPSLQLRELEKLAMKIRLANNISINDEVNKTRNKYPRIK